MIKFGVTCILTLVIALACGTSYAYTEGNRPSTAERHKIYGVECKGCHKDNNKKFFDSKQCLSCHGSYEKLAERTKKLERNPHKSHYDDLECNACHHGHKPDENFCSTCHPDHQDPKEMRIAKKKYVGSFLLCLMVAGGVFVSKELRGQ